MATKKKKPATKELAFSYGNRKWKSSQPGSSSLDALLQAINTRPNPLPLPAPDEINQDFIKIVVVVAENPTYFARDAAGIAQLRSVKLECGRAAAQAAHAVSKLKLSYIAEHCQGGQTDQAYGLVLKVMAKKVTTITVKARDTAELQHIEHLLEIKKMHSAKFYDENPQFYGDVIGGEVLTAIAIGPYKTEEFYGITNYLPLWKCKCDLVP